MHFTSMKVLRGNASLTINAGTDFSLAENAVKRTLNAAGQYIVSEVSDGQHSSAPSISASAATDPSFEVAIYDNDKFQRGIMQPIAPKLYGYFLNQGWPADYLAQVFVERIEFYQERKARSNGVTNDGKEKFEKGDLLYTFNNDPDNEHQHKEFLDFVSFYELGVVSTSRKKIDLMELSAIQMKSSLADIAVLDGEKFDLAAQGAGSPIIQRIKPAGTSIAIKRLRKDGVVAPKYQYDCYKASTSQVFDEAAQLISENASKQRSFPKDKIKSLDALTESGSLERVLSFVKLASSNEDSKLDHEQDSRTFCTLDGNLVTDTTVVLRSPDSILYYLGEYIRGYEAAQTKKKNHPVVNGIVPSDLYSKKVIAVYSGTTDKRPLVSTTYNGQEYFIADDTANVDEDGNPYDRSTQTLGLVQQLINLHKSSDDLPAASSVVVAP